MKHKKTQPLKSLGYFLFVLCAFGALPCQGKENFAFTVFAEVQSEVYVSDSPTPSHVYRYSVTLRSSNDWWDISSRSVGTTNSPNLTQYFGVIPDGTRTIFLSDDYATSPLATYAQAKRSLHPGLGDAALFCPWLSFCPHPALPYLEDQQMASLAEVAGAPPYRYGLEWLPPDNWFLQSLSLTNDGRGMNPQGVFFNYPEPYQNGFLFFQYKLLTTTNTFGHVFPATAVFYRVTVKKKAGSAAYLGTNVVTRIQVDQITKGIEPYKLPQLMVVDDERPNELPNGRPIRYGVTNDVWYPVTNNLVLRSIREAKQMIVLPSVAPNKSNER